MADTLAQKFTTPMMRQYAAIKDKYRDCLLFFRMGDFYELFLDDAYIGAEVLGITLTARPNGKDGRTPMAGVPYHAVDGYLAKLVEAGYKVAICEQVSLPDKYGIVDREVIRIVTPGTVLDEKALAKKENNYIVALTIEDNILGLAISDISTGYFATLQTEFTDLGKTIRDELSKIKPRECILPDNLYNDPDVLKILKSERGLNIYRFGEWDNYSTRARNVLKKHFGTSTLASFGVENKKLAQVASATLLGYLQQTQKSTVAHVNKLISITDDSYLFLDRASIINLELFSTIREHDPKGSLLYVLDQTITPMGGRLLKQWMIKPLVNKDEIMLRLDAVEEFYKEIEFRENLREQMKQLPDIERLISRLSVGLGNARDLVNLRLALEVIIDIQSTLNLSKTKLAKDIRKSIGKEISEVITIISKYLVDEPPISIREGGMIRRGIDGELDKLTSKVKAAREWILTLEQKEKERTGIASLKVRFNKVFGFYIEISKSNLHLIPDNYIRKQTLVNGERFITPELKEKEEIILTAEERINDLEYKLFLKVLEDILSFTKSLQETAGAIATLDCITNFAYLAQIYKYTRPQLLYSGEIKIKGGRHPVVEQLLDETQFIPNDVDFGNLREQILLITGPNMAGKSVFIRQIAIITLMAQMGSFVPAEKAQISLVDRIFVRSGASDVITSGLSTFMVEMVETAHILHNATKNSLIIMDEIGRGTSTYDGISIAWAVAEYLATHYKMPPKTLFATHYHELQVLEEQHPKKIKNYHMATENDGGEPVFLHTIVPGGASHSFGIAVAKLAGIPAEVIGKASEILINLESRNIDRAQEVKTILIPQKEMRETNLIEKIVLSELLELDIHSITPLDALNKLADLKDKVKLVQPAAIDLTELEPQD